MRPYSPPPPRREKTSKIDFLGKNQFGRESKKYSSFLHLIRDGGGEELLKRKSIPILDKEVAHE